jgi:DeoR family transcriptional regulator of aga operon
VTGGELLDSVYALVGERAVAFLRDLRVDWTFLGADAIDPHAGITNTNMLEVPLKRAMLEAGRHKIVLAGSAKFGQRALVRVAKVTEVDGIITDDELTPAEAARYLVRVHRVAVGRKTGRRLRRGVARRAAGVG